MQQVPINFTATPTDQSDCQIYLSSHNLQHALTTFPFLCTFAQIDRSFATRISLIPDSKGKRFVHAPVARDAEYGDVRQVGRTAREALRIAIASGSTDPLILIDDSCADCIDVIIAQCNQELYTPPVESTILHPKKINSLTICTKAPTLLDAATLESAKMLCRIIGGGPPEQMLPLQCAQTIEQAMKGTGIAFECITDTAVLTKQYPLLVAVARCSLQVPRHAPAVVKLVYNAPNPKRHIRLVGKGVVYDTGGADLKVAGAMTGMSRDKCGAATIAGLMLAVSKVKPAHTSFSASLAFVRNSIGADAYVCDEVITARSGATVRVGNTDAEGRMAMADLLCEAHEEAAAASASVDSLLLTAATLTGHVVRAYGHCAAIVPNAAALSMRLPWQLQSAGAPLGELWEVSRLYLEDFEFVSGAATFVDLHSANNLPSTATPRGHQYPAAFLIEAAGMRRSRVPYLHLDIAAVAEESVLGKPTAFGVASLMKYFDLGVLE